MYIDLTRRCKLLGFVFYSFNPGGTMWPGSLHGQADREAKNLNNNNNNNVCCCYL